MLVCVCGQVQCLKLLRCGYPGTARRRRCVNWSDAELHKCSRATWPGEAQHGPRKRCRWPRLRESGPKPRPKRKTEKKPAEPSRLLSKLGGGVPPRERTTAGKRFVSRRFPCVVKSHSWQVQERANVARVSCAANESWLNGASKRREVTGSSAVDGHT